MVNLPDAKGANVGATGSMLGVVDHLSNGGVETLSPCPVTHFPQHDFVRLLRRRAKNSRFCYLLKGCHAEVIETSPTMSLMLTDVRTDRRHVQSALFVIGADGAHSVLRDQLGIELVGKTGTLQHLINVHFFSRLLAERLRSTIPAMLYFLYSPAGVGVVVAHSLSKGEFVAQIPFFPPLQPAASFSEGRCSRMIQQWIGRAMPIQVKSIRQWRMRVGLASRFQSPNGRCFLVGDAAHQFTPAGGFGMNTGIQDAHNLVWKIVLALRANQAENRYDAEQLLSSYEIERRPVAADNARWSIENYEQTLLVPRAMGLNPSAAKALHFLCTRLPGPLSAKRALFAAAMKLGQQQLAWMDADNPIANYRKRSLRHIFHDARHLTLRLLFPGQDLGFCYAPDMAAGSCLCEAATDPFNYTPSLRIGGRMPHCWIREESGQRLSVLDLPTFTMADDGLPRHVLIMVGAVDQNMWRRADRQIATLHPVATVHIGTPSAPSDAHRFHFCGNRPAFLPLTAAILMRPDGHIQWYTLSPSGVAQPDCL
jgi:2-polyprenyl-6-methoxyphenol hydroxylase-like FAD-dependent oxidoreductase